MFYLSIILIAVITMLLMNTYQRKIDELIFIDIEKHIEQKFADLNINAKGLTLVNKKDSRPTNRLTETHRIYKDIENQYYLYMGSNLDQGTVIPLSPQRARNALCNNKKAFEREFPGEKI